jgi:hypothetical protein
MRDILAALQRIDEVSLSHLMVKQFHSCSSMRIGLAEGAKTHSYRFFFLVHIYVQKRLSPGVNHD